MIVSSYSAPFLPLPRFLNIVDTAYLGACPRIGTVAREVHFESFFRSFEANSYSYSTKMSGKKGQNELSAVGVLFSDRLLGNL